MYACIALLSHSTTASDSLRPAKGHVKSASISAATNPDPNVDPLRQR